jgi:hypothetical protein
MAKTFVLSVLLLIGAAPARAEFTASGYLKTIEQWSRGLLDDRPYNLNTSRARLTLDYNQSEFKAHADYDHQLAVGSYFRTADFHVFGYAPPSPWLTMQSTISTGTLNGYGQGVYRGWVGYENEKMTVRVGRQRVAWGTGKIWNPTDVLNPYQPTSVERDERRGVDALYGRAALGTLGQAELAWAPNDRWVDHAVLARVRENAGGWDASVLGGKIAGSTASMVVGGDFAGTVFDGTLHGELAWFSPEIRTPYLKAGLGYDYTFTSEARALRFIRNASIAVEWYHAGEGQTDVRRYDFSGVRAGREVGVARDYFGATWSQDLHPLVKLELVAIVNADDASTFFAPSLTFNAWKDLYLTSALQRFGGERRTEFGRAPNQLVLTGQYYF